VCVYNEELRGWDRKMGGGRCAERRRELFRNSCLPIPSSSFDSQPHHHHHGACPLITLVDHVTRTTVAIVTYNRRLPSALPHFCLGCTSSFIAYGNLRSFFPRACLRPFYTPISTPNFYIYIHVYCILYIVYCILYVVYVYI
jgi:hypothetical protein